MTYCWKEPLPEQCPPEAARVPIGIDFFRFVRDPSNVTLDDFNSLIALGRKVSDSCQGHALSGYISYDECKRLRRIHKYLKKFQGTIKIMLHEDCGKVLETPSEASGFHISWWVYAGYAPLNNYTIVDDVL